MKIKIEKSKIVFVIVWAVFATGYAAAHIFVDALDKDIGIFFLWLYLVGFIIHYAINE